MNRLAQLCALVVASLMAPALGTPAAVAGAPAPHLTWNDCYLGGFQVSTLDDACEPGPVGPHSLVVSVSPDEPMTLVNGAVGLIDVYFDADDIPDFWRVQNGGCAAGMLTGDFFANPNLPATSCPDPWSATGGQLGGMNWAPRYDSCNNRVRITWLVAIPAPATVTLDAQGATTWSLFRIVLNSDPGTCAGCEAAACFSVNQVRVTRPAGAPGGDYFLYGYDVSSYAKWQSDPSLPCSPWESGPIPCPTPVRKNTWGQLKGLYR